MPSTPGDLPGPVPAVESDGTEPGTSGDYGNAVLAGMSEGVAVQLARGEIVSCCNPAAERILGLTHDQMAGRTSVDPRWRSIHEDGSPFPGETTTHPAMVTLTTGQPLRDVVMGVHTPDGALTWISINSPPVPGSGGRPASAVTTLIDTTDRLVVVRVADREGFQRSRSPVRVPTTPPP